VKDADSKVNAVVLQRDIKLVFEHEFLNLGFMSSEFAKIARISSLFLLW
jgi:hypothetical protein